MCCCDRVFRAPLHFFDTTPVGRIVNRFSKDFDTIDATVPVSIIQFCVQWTTAISIIIVASSVLPALIVVLVFVAIVNSYYSIQFVSASRKLKRMDSVSRSPLFTHFGETVTGVTTIRAFGMTQQRMLDMFKRTDVNTRPMYYAFAIARWVSTRSSFMGAIIAFVTCVFILFNLDHLDAATAGFFLNYILVFTNMVG
jgi:ABC-type multidrug transport system fused ATPase/permease subunit